MPRASVRTRSTSMEARVAALEALGSKKQLLLESNQCLLESMQRLFEDKFASIDKRFESIDARLEGSNEKDGESSRRQGGLDPREKEKGYPSDGRMPFIKMDFPRFSDGDDPIEWVYKTEQYFDYFSVPPEKKVKMVSFHCDREVLQWFQWEEYASSFSNWEDFTKAFCKEFGPHGFEDLAEAFFKLRQTGTLKDYIAEFRRLATRIRDLSPTLRLSCFIGGLREVIRHDVKLLRPATVHEAMSFAHEVDAKFQILRLVHSSGNSSSRLPQSPLQHDVIPARTRIEPTSGKDMSFKKLTPEEVQFKRQNNLCFYCDEKFVRGHKCARKQVLLLDMGYNSSEEEEIAQESQPVEQITEVNA